MDVEGLICKGETASLHQIQQQFVEVMDNQDHLMDSVPLESRMETVVETPAPHSPDDKEDSVLSDRCQVETHVENISMKDLSELLAQDDTMSVVIINENGEPVEWLQQTEIVVEKEVENCSDSQDLLASQVSEVGVKCESMTKSGGSECDDLVVYTIQAGSQDAAGSETVTGLSRNPENSGTRKRSHDSPHLEPAPKIQRLSTAQEGCSSPVADNLARCEQNDDSNTADIDQNINQTKAQESHVIIYTSGSEHKSLSSVPTPTSIVKSHSPYISIQTSPSLTVTSKSSTGVKLLQASSHQPGEGLPQHLKEISTAKTESQQLVKSAASQILTASAEKAIRKSTAPSEKKQSEGSATTGSVQQVDVKYVKASGEGSSAHVVDTNMVYRCAECDYASSNKHYYKQHVDLVHKTARPFKCPFCDYAGKRGHALREHLIVHSVDKPFSCAHCNATFRKKAHLTSHTKLHSVKHSRGTDMTSPKSSENFVVFTIAADNRLKPASTGLAVAEQAPKAVTTDVGVPVVSPGAAMPEFWCALCKQAMADASSFQAHLQSAHKTDRLFACESCDFVTAHKSDILAHLPVHLSGTKSAVQSLAPSAPVPVACKPIFSCTECDFKTPSMNQLRAHAVSHTTATTPKTVVLDHPTQQQVQQAQQQHQQQQKPVVSKVICSECGFVASDAEVMKTHMWTHITKDTETKDKPGFAVTSELRPSASGTDSSSVMKLIPGSSSELKAMKTLPQNAAFKCTECNYTSRDASLFVKHMLVHKARQKPVLVSKVRQTPTTNNQVTASVPESDGTVTVAAGSNGKSSHLYQVKPVTTENTCKNTETSPFVHDAATGRFRCTICGYTCEYQRTIKAHIWKHSGHHQVDYPIFQNGPLSVYEDPVPVPVKVIKMSTPTPPSSASNLEAAPPSITAKLQGPGQDSKIVPAQATLGQTAVAKEAVVKPVPGLKVVKVMGLQPHAPGRPAQGKLSIVASPSSSQQLPSDAAGKHLIVHVRSGLAESRPVPAGSVKVKQGSVATVEKEGGQGKVPHAGAKPVAKIKEEEQTSLVCGADAVKEERGTPPTSQANGLMKKSDVAVEGPSKVMLMKAVEKSSAFPKLVTTQAGADDVLAPSSVLEIMAKSCSAASNVTATSNQETAQRSDSRDVKQNKPTHQPSAEAEGQLITSGDRAVASHDSLTMQTRSTVQQPAQSMVGCQATEGEADSLETGIPPKQTSGDGENKAVLPADSQEGISSKTAANKKAEGSSPRSSPNVVVETVPSVTAGTILTGLQLRCSSPRVSCSQTSSPVAVSNQQHQYSLRHKTTVPDSGAERGKRSDVQTQNKTLDPKKGQLKHEDSRTAKETLKHEVGGEESPPTDSESAVTLLSLLKRGPNFNPACPQASVGTIDTGPAADILTTQQSPDRPSSTGSDSDSKGVSVGDLASEEAASEVDSTVSGKSRGGSGGICSSLLAVIEQLRERSRSESDPEDRSAPSQPKKRATRRRGRRESQEEALGPEDSDNIEQLEGEDTVTYRCKLCHYTSSRIPLIRLHMRTHRQKDPFECSLCPLVAESSEALQEHMIQHCKVRTYPCKFCPQSFNHKSTLRAHMRAHNDSEPFLCDLCEFETASPLEYRAHMQKHAGVTLLQCPNCPALVSSHQDLESHLAGGCPAKSHHGQPSEGRQRNIHDVAELGKALVGRERLVCSQCEFSAPDVAGLREHMVEKHAYGAGMSLNAEDSGGLLRCALCEFTAVSSRSLKSHMKRHANDQRYVQQPLEQYKCALCGYVCHHLPSLKSHMWRHASDQNYSYQFTNDVINAAIDYDTRVDLVPTSSGKGSGDEEPELLERFLSAERRIMEGQLSKMVDVGSDPLCWVTFRCCQCGFETINKAKLNLHMRTHADIINRTLKVKVEPSAPVSEDTDVDKVKLKVVYEPV